jgi:hypothetical protein
VQLDAFSVTCSDGAQQERMEEPEPATSATFMFTEGRFGARKVMCHLWNVASFAKELPPSPTFTVTKVVEGEAAGLVPSDVAFEVSASWAGGGESFTVKNDGLAATSPELPLDTEITVTETGFPGIAGVWWRGYHLYCVVDGEMGPVPPNDTPAQFTINKKTRSVDCTLTNTARYFPPEITNSAVDAVDGDRILAWNGGTVVDTVTYQNLLPGKEYTISGELVNKADGTGTGITASVTFIAAASSGEVTLSFVVPSEYAGKTLVAHAWLFKGRSAGDRQDALSKRTGMNNAAQTVVVESPPSSASPSGDPTLRSGDSASPRGDSASPLKAAASNLRQPMRKNLPETGNQVPHSMIPSAFAMIVAGFVLVLTRRMRCE